MKLLIVSERKVQGFSLLTLGMPERSMRHLPQTARPTQILEWDGGQQRRILDELAAEEPLEIRVGGAPISVTMRTPGDDFELAAGFLFTEGVITRREQIDRLAYARGPEHQLSGTV